MDLSLIGKNALVGGGSKGLGWASAQVLAHLGASVTLVSRSEDLMVDLLQILPRQAGQDHDYLVADFTDPADVHRKIISLLGIKNIIHILINNTGGPPGGDTLHATPEAFESAFRQHILCSQLLVQAIVPGMRQANYGRIINIISISVKTPIPGLGVSNTIRGAMASWAKSLSNELAPDNITVNNVLPGMTRTDRLNSLIQNKAQATGTSIQDVEKAMISEIPMGRFGRAEELGQTVGFLASPAASYITGINLPVDGGRTKTL